MITIKEIAKKAGVSAGTVDRVLHDRGMVKEKTRERILTVIEESGYKPNIVGQGLAIRKKKLKIGFIITDFTANPFFKDIWDAAKKKAEEIQQFGVQVLFYLVRHTGQNIDSFEIDEKIDEDIMELDGLATLGMDGPTLKKYLDIMEEREKPVVFYNAVTPGRDFLAYVGCNYLDSGKLAAGLCALAGKEDARVCVYSQGLFGVSSFSERITGFQKEMERKYPEMKLLDYREIHEDPIDNYLSAKDMLERYPDVNIVYVANPADYSICYAIYRADEKHQVKIITNDIVEVQAKMMRQGIISATVCQEPEKQGALSLEILFRYLAYGLEPEHKINYTNLSIHLAQNI